MEHKGSNFSQQTPPAKTRSSFKVSWNSARLMRPFPSASISSRSNRSTHKDANGSHAMLLCPYEMHFILRVCQLRGLHVAVLDKQGMRTRTRTDWEKETHLAEDKCEEMQVIFRKPHENCFRSCDRLGSGSLQETRQKGIEGVLGAKMWGKYRFAGGTQPQPSNLQKSCSFLEGNA